MPPANSKTNFAVGFFAGVCFMLPVRQLILQQIPCINPGPALKRIGCEIGLGFTAAAAGVFLLVPRFGSFGRGTANNAQS